MNCTRLALLLCALCGLLASCAAPSISQIGTRYSQAYAGELHPIELVRSLAIDPDGPTPRLVEGERVLLVQSGAERPDPLLLEAFDGRFELEVGSGVPFGVAWNGWAWARTEGTSSSDYGRQLQRTARSLGVDAILVVFGRLDLDRRETIGALIGWIPIVGYPVPMIRTTADIRGTLLLVDPESGRSRQLVVEDLGQVARVTSSMWSEARDLDALGDEVKSAAYPRWAEQALAAFAE